MNGRLSRNIRAGACRDLTLNKGWELSSADIMGLKTSPQTRLDSSCKMSLEKAVSNSGCSSWEMVYNGRCESRHSLLATWNILNGCVRLKICRKQIMDWKYVEYNFFQRFREVKSILELLMKKVEIVCGIIAYGVANWTVVWRANLASLFRCVVAFFLISRL